jgi:homoserine O-acetyltransferase/O-succinyltransferase
MQRLIPSVPHGRFVEVPEGEHSYGHQTQTHPEAWKGYVSELLAGH